MMTKYLLSFLYSVASAVPLVAAGNFLLRDIHLRAILGRRPISCVDNPKGWLFNAQDYLSEWMILAIFIAWCAWPMLFLCVRFLYRDCAVLVRGMLFALGTTVLLLYLFVGPTGFMDAGNVIDTQIGIWRGAALGSGWKLGMTATGSTTERRGIIPPSFPRTGGRALRPRSCVLGASVFSPHGRASVHASRFPEKAKG